MSAWNVPAERQFRYFLNSDRIGFRLWCDEDLPLAQSLWGDPRVTRLFLGEPLTEQKVFERLHAEIEKEKKFGVQYWPIFERGTNAFLGCCGLRPYKVPDGIYELGFHLVADAWGKGIASEAARTVVDYAFKDLGVKELFAGHHPDNAASRKILLNCGFVEGSPNFYEPTGLFHPSYFLKASQSF